MANVTAEFRTGELAGGIVVATVLSDEDTDQEVVEVAMSCRSVRGQCWKVITRKSLE